MDDRWRLWVDTGGTFTDCLALSPDGRLQRVKVLSSSTLRGTVTAVEGDRLGFRAAWRLPEGFAVGSRFRVLGSKHERPVVGSDDRHLQLKPTDVVGPADVVESGTPFELLFDEEAPVLAARLVTGTARVEDLPPLEMRLATTRGTNALLERRGARTVLLVTRGFADLLRIGEQHRPELFAREVRRPEPLYEAVIEVDERLDAQGRVLRPLDVGDLERKTAGLKREGFESAAVALMHSYLDPGHERAAEALLRDSGFEHVSASADLTPTIKILPRARTAVVDAYLSPVVGRYLDRVIGAVGRDRLQVMTSSGGLVDAASYRAKDSLLSGPAGGVVGAARSAQTHGVERLVAFDMGGTSTDVSRFDGDYDYRFSHRVGDVTLAAPALAIETVAAGGGSICRPEHGVLKVGPQSAGAFPGPACYGAGGPLTVTDVNLLLGRLEPERFEIPVERQAAERLAEEQVRSLRNSGSTLELDSLLLGYLAIANQRMADAVRQISVRKGYDPAVYTMVAFGGAGGLHACAVAEQLGIGRVLWPREAGVLSAFGLGAAVLERFEERQVLRPLDAVADRLPTWIQELADRALETIAQGAVDRFEIRRRLAFLRLAGQESTLELEIRGTVQELEESFYTQYQERYGYRPADREVELESIRVVVSSQPLLDRGTEASSRPGAQAKASSERSVCFADRRQRTSVYELDRLGAGDCFDGPALVFDRHASFVVSPEWRAVYSGRALVVERVTGPLETA